MAVKVFFLGRPGSGKTTAAHYIGKLAQREGLSVSAINDYTVLQAMIQLDAYRDKFCRTAHNGFDVLDFSVLDEALKEVEELAKRQNGSCNLITIEFARDNYGKALYNFQPEFLKHSCFLYFNTNVEVCLERIHTRVASPNSQDDHPSLSDDKFRTYYGTDAISDNFRDWYGNDNIYCIANLLKDLDPRHKDLNQQLYFIMNECTKEAFKQELDDCYNNFVRPALFKQICALV